jgi:hypothetical protein
VEWVEDEWERELVSEEDLNLLFVKYDANRITVLQLLETISEFGFEAKVSE